MQQATDLHQLATLYADSLIQHLPAGPCIIAGIGLSSMVAFELSLQLHHRHKQVQLLTVFESVPVSVARLALPGLDEALTAELVHVWCALYHLVVEAASQQQHSVDESGSSQSLQLQQPLQQLPDLCSVVTHLHSLQSYEQQLDYISGMCPAAVEPQLWDSRVHETLSCALHLMQLLHGYQPRESLGCPVVVVHDLREQQAPVTSLDSLALVAEDSWRHVAPALLPVMTCDMRAEADAGISSAAPVSVLDSVFGTTVSVGQAAAAAREPLEPAGIDNQSALAVPLNRLCAASRYRLFPSPESTTAGVCSTSVRRSGHMQHLRLSCIKSSSPWALCTRSCTNVQCAHLQPA